MLAGQWLLRCTQSYSCNTGSARASPCAERHRNHLFLAHRREIYCIGRLVFGAVAPIPISGSHFCFATLCQGQCSTDFAILPFFYARLQEDTEYQHTYDVLIASEPKPVPGASPTTPYRHISAPSLTAYSRYIVPEASALCPTPPTSHFLFIE
jgi:hypothetical protein